MKIFNQFNTTGPACPICNTCNEGKAVLIPIDGTQEDNIAEALQVHLECLDLRLDKKDNTIVIYQFILNKSK